jgi:hypothetical protein
MKPKFYPLLQQCVENGIVRGWNRAHKHTDTPDILHVQTQIFDEIFSELHEWFEFPDQSEAE